VRACETAGVCAWMCVCIFGVYKSVRICA